MPRRAQHRPDGLHQTSIHAFFNVASKPAVAPGPATPDAQAPADVPPKPLDDDTATQQPTINRPGHSLKDPIMLDDDDPPTIQAPDAQFPSAFRLQIPLDLPCQPSATTREAFTYMNELYGSSLPWELPGYLDEFDHDTLSDDYDAGYETTDSDNASSHVSLGHVPLDADIAEWAPHNRPKEIDCDAELDEVMRTTWVPTKDTQFGGRAFQAGINGLLLKEWLKRTHTNPRLRAALEAFADVDCEASASAAPEHEAPEPMIDPLGFPSTCRDTSRAWEKAAMNITQSDTRVQMTDLVGWSGSIHASLAILALYPPKQAPFSESRNLDSPPMAYLDSKLYGSSEVFVGHIVPLGCAHYSNTHEGPNFAEPYRDIYGDGATSACLNEAAALVGILDARVVVVCGETARQWLLDTKPTLKRIPLGSESEDDASILAEMDGNNIKRLFLTTFHLEALFYVQHRMLRFSMDETINIACFLTGLPLARPYLFLFTFDQSHFNGTAMTMQHADVMRMCRTSGPLRTVLYLFEAEKSFKSSINHDDIPQSLMKEMDLRDYRNPYGYDVERYEVPYVSPLQQIIVSMLYRLPKHTVSSDLLKRLGMIPGLKPLSGTKSKLEQSKILETAHLREMAGRKLNRREKLDADLKWGFEPYPFSRMVNNLFVKGSEFDSIRQGTPKPNLAWAAIYRSKRIKTPVRAFMRDVFLQGCRGDRQALEDAWLSFVPAAKKDKLPPSMLPRWAFVDRFWDTPKGQAMLDGWVASGQADSDDDEAEGD